MNRLIKLTTPIIAIILVGLLSMQFLQSCRKKIDYIDGKIVPYDNSVKVTASIYGIVMDESGTPVANASVSTGAYATTTNSDGLYFFNNISIPQHATTVLVKKANHFNGAKTIPVRNGQKHQINVTLINKGIPETFVGSNGGTVQFNGLTITFNPNSVVEKATGNLYTGQVLVYAKHIDPTTELGRAIMPGDLRGVTAVGSEERLLRSYSMMATELTDINGNALQIRDNNQAVVSFNIPSSLLASAPSTIPLWYYDEATGVWMEEGVAYLKNGKYEGNVKHFSFWNCDTPAAAIDIEMTVIDQNNAPIQGFTVKLTNQANMDSRYGTTNASGWVGGLCYPNATLTLEIFTPSGLCGAPILVHTQNVVTTSVNLNLGTIVVTLPSINSCTFDGTVIDCANFPNGNSLVHVMPLNIFVTPTSSGYFTFTLPCVPTLPLTFSAYDLGNNVNGTSTATLNAGINNLGNLYACGQVTPFLNMTLTNTVTSVSQTINFTSPTSTIVAEVGEDTIASVIYPSTAISAYGGTNNQYVTIKCLDSTVNTTPIQSVNMWVGNTVFTDVQYALAPGSTITFTSFPIYPGHVLGNYSMSLVGSPSTNTYTASGSFRAVRTN